MRRVGATILAVLLLGPTAFAARDSRALDDWFDLPVPGGASTLAALGIPLDERAFTLSIAARAIHDRESRIGLAPDRLARILTAVAAPAVGARDDRDRDIISIPAPLSERLWRDLLALGAEDDLFASLLTDRNALLLAVALTTTTPSIRALVSRDHNLLRFLYRDAAGAFLVTARSLRIVEDQIVVPGGNSLRPIWERLARSPASRPAGFLRALLTKDRGRLAWYFDTIAGMAETRLAVAWPGVTSAERLQSATLLYAAFRDSDRQWHTADQPFRRNVADAWTIAMLTDVADGRLVGSRCGAFWDLVFGGDVVDSDQARRELRGDGASWTMARLASAILGSPVRERRDRFEMFRLVQRAFPASAGALLPHVAVAVSGHRMYRGLTLALERMDIADPETFALVVRAARHLSNSADAERTGLASFQSAIALIERVRHVRTIDAATADRLLRRLSEAVRNDRRVTRSIGRWIQSSLVPGLPPLERPDAWTTKTAYESSILQALAGPLDRATPVLEWEGLSYKIDIVAAEHARLRAVRRQVPSPGLDAALESGKASHLADALTALVYTVALGDAEGAARLSRDVATRHDFGLTSTSLVRETTPWSPPEERQGMGPWHVQGSLLGLDRGLSRLALRRVADQHMPAAPTVTLNDRAAMTRTIVSMVPAELDDAERDEIGVAIARGRRRVADAGTQAAELDVLAAEVQMSAASRQLVPWIASRQPDDLAGVFSLRDLLWLGHPALTRVQLDRWGMAADGLDGRHTTAMPPPAAWEDFAGRPDAGQITTQVPDLTLRLVEEAARLKIPSALVPSLLAFAVEDFWHDAQVRFPDDWLRMTRQAAALESSRIEDYVAALVGNGPLRAQ